MKWFFISSAIAILLWFAWQLIKAKKFTQFKEFLNEDVVLKVKQSIIETLLNERSDVFPNNDTHQMAACDFWTKHPVRILQWALTHNILNEQQLKKDKQWRNCQHLFHIERVYMVKHQKKLSDTGEET